MKDCLCCGKELSEKLFMGGDICIKCWKERERPRVSSSPTPAKRDERRRQEDDDMLGNVIAAGIILGGILDD